MSTPAAEVHDLVVKYGDSTVLTNVSATFAPSEIRVILGTSGCGKTTLLKTMIGLLKPAAGVVHLFGQPLGDIDDPETVVLLRRIGVLFQNGAMLGSLTTAENVALPLEMHTELPATIIREIVRNKLAQVGMPNAGPLYPSELSGGMRKRAALARALALEPPLVFCDEPSAGLDPVTSAGLDELLLSLREALGITLVVVTHELASIERIADNIVFLHKGSVLFEGALSEARKQSSGAIADFFNRQERGTAETEKHADFFTVESTL